MGQAFLGQAFLGQASLGQASLALTLEALSWRDLGAGDLDVRELELFVEVRGGPVLGEETLPYSTRFSSTLGLLRDGENSHSMKVG